MSISSVPGEKNCVQKQVDAEIDRLAMACDKCGSILDQLEGCLSRSVLRDPPPSDDGKGISAVTAVVPVASRIREYAWTVQSMTEKLQSIMDRIEV